MFILLGSSQPTSVHSASKVEVFNDLNWNKIFHMHRYKQSAKLSHIFLQYEKKSCSSLEAALFSKKSNTIVQTSKENNLTHLY